MDHLEISRGNGLFGYAKKMNASETKDESLKQEKTRLCSSPATLHFASRFVTVPDIVIVNYRLSGATKRLVLGDSLLLQCLRIYDILSS